MNGATAAQWRKAIAANRLATSADFAVAALGSDKALALGSMDRLKPYANQIMTCIDIAATADGAKNLRVVDLGASCLVIMDNMR